MAKFPHGVPELLPSLFVSLQLEKKKVVILYSACSVHLIKE